MGYQGLRRHIKKNRVVNCREVSMNDIKLSFVNTLSARAHGTTDFRPLLCQSLALRLRQIPGVQALLAV
jgi:hypothetical protein